MTRITRDAHSLGESKPVEHFRPRLFKQIDRKQETLKLDVFWPIEKKNELDPIPRYLRPEHDSDHDDPACDDHIFPVHELEPLLEFRNLRVLQLSGMAQSYQPLIWRAVWANPKLSVLTLEMALPPLFNTTSKHPNRIIDADWTVFPSISPRPSMSSEYVNISPPPGDDDSTADEPAYLGHPEGNGRLHPDFGRGEYLDDLAIKHALVAANDDGALSGVYRRFLSIKELTLMNFVVDGIPFVNWFDPSVLRKITFRGICIDAGFYLHATMKNVSLHPPLAAIEEVGVAQTVRVEELVAARSITRATTAPMLVDIKDGKVTSRVKAGEFVQVQKPSKFRSIRNTLLGRLGRGKENKTADKNTASDSGEIDSVDGGSILSRVPSVLGGRAGSATGCL